MNQTAETAENAEEISIILSANSANSVVSIVKMRINRHEILENIAFALTAIRTHKLRSLLTVLGVVIGTMTVTAVSSVLTGLEIQTREYAETFGPDVLYVTKFDKIGIRFSRAPREERMRKPLQYDDALAITKLPTVKAATPFLIYGSFGPSGAGFPVKYRGVEASRPILFGVWPTYPDVRNVPLKQGRFFTATEHDRRLNVAVIGASIADTLFGAGDPIEKEIVIENNVFRVLGVMEKGPGGLFGGDNIEDRTILVPFATLDKMHPEIESLAVIAHSYPGQFGEMVDQITELMRRRRGVPADRPNDFGLNEPLGVFEAVRDISAIIALIVIPISATGLLIGGVGIMNIMLVSVTERTKEIGVRRAIGARRRDIVQQFLIEAVALALVGGGLGVLVGILISAILHQVIPNIPSQVPLWSILAGLGVSISVGLIFGLWPAIKAARLDPVYALRYE